MLINSSTNFTKRLDEFLDHHAKGPQLTLEANTSAGTVHTGKTDFDQVRGVRTEQASLGKALGDEWKSNLHSRQLVFAMSKLINPHRAERQRPRQATTAAESTSRSSVAEEGLNALN
ncbi:hypothetical protein, partial [Pseudomonas amygdali]|uniref:hypothetical protein n=1 Tax=Pseudomonas amygdali TaxID=47877 RepID=UPI0001CC3F7F